MFSFLKNKKKITAITHSGPFHADDVFATATLRILAEKRDWLLDIKRTRDPEVIKTGDIVYDVGSIYDPDNNFFDHHQRNFSEHRENGTPFSSFGLIWKKFGIEICNQNERAANLIDKNLVEAIDAGDTGYETFESEKNIKNYSADDIIDSWNQSNFIDKSGDRIKISKSKQYFNFLRAVSVAKEVLENEINKSFLQISDYDDVTKIYENSDSHEFGFGKKVIFLPTGMSWKDALVSKSEPILVAFPYSEDNDYMIQAVPVAKNSIKTRFRFPENWRGLNSNALEKESGIKGMKFCHLNGHLCATDSLDSAKKVIEKIML